MNYKKAIIQILSSILLLISCQIALAVEIKATIDRNPVNINESFQITFTASQSPNGEPNFSLLEKDFKILRQSQKKYSSMINGQHSKTIQWVLDVTAKQPGYLPIPPISFGTDTSQPMTLLVNKNTSFSGNDNQDLFLEVEISNKKPYVQAQVIYTLRFFQKVQTTQASLNGLELTGAIIEQLDQEKSYTTERNGAPFKVTELKYAIFPQKSGSQTIKPITLSTDVIIDTQQRFNGFFNRPRTKNIQISSKEITLEVQPAPKDFSNKYWLPSEHVYIEEKWSGDPSKMKTGEPLTRTLSVLAKEATKNQLPELHTDQKLSDLKTYPDQPILKDQKNAKGLIAFREEKIAYIPSKPGTYTLPAIEIPWFNTETKKMEVARIQETTITATASEQSAIHSPSSSASTQVMPGQSEPIIKTVESSFWKWFSFFLACGWLATLYYFFKKFTIEKEILPATPQEIKLKEAIKSVKRACKENNQANAKDALIAWGRIKFNKSSLSSIAPHCEARLRDEILIINQNLYTQKNLHWNSNSLLKTFSEHIAREKIAKKTNDALEPLFKI
ncbi:MAG: protein BatD [Methylococcales bacterium]|nr:protein BatD [Methylococcales bacterium]